MSDLCIVLVPGAFALPEYYNKLLEALSPKSYDIRPLHMPTVGLSTLEGRPGTPPTMYDDAALIASEVEKLADQGKHIILLGHSYGGVPVTQSTKGLSTTGRNARGKKGGIVELAYMTCLVPPLGGTATSILAGVPNDAQLEMKMDENGWLYHSNPAATAAITFSSIPLAEGEAWIRKFPKHSAACYTNELTYAGYKDIRVSYLVCEEDRCIPPEIQRSGIELIEKESGKKAEVKSIKADHCPNETATELVVEWIVSVVERVKARRE